MQHPYSGRVHKYENKQNSHYFQDFTIGFVSCFDTQYLKKYRILHVSDFRKKKKLIVDPSKTDEKHLKAMCYVYVLQLRSLLLKQPSFSKVLRRHNTYT